MHDEPTVISQQVFIRCLSPLEGMQPAVLTFDSRTPYAVRITLGEDGPGWELARTVLLRGISGVAGAGHARVWPIVNDAGRSLVVLHLETVDGELVAEVLTTQLDHFLGRTLAAVPLGTESGLLDLDGVIEALLSAEPT